ncbi:hypothetical protein ABWC91_003216 [Yersinia enterocolitica]
MLSKEKMIDMQEVVDDCKSFSGMSFSGNLFKVTQFQKAPGLLGEALEEVISLREQLAAINGAQEPVGFVKCDPCAEDCRWDCVDPIYLAGSVTPEGYGSDYFEVYRHPAPLKE